MEQSGQQPAKSQTQDRRRLKELESIIVTQIPRSLVKVGFEVYTQGLRFRLRYHIVIDTLLNS